MNSLSNAHMLHLVQDKTGNNLLYFNIFNPYEQDRTVYFSAIWDSLDN